MVTQRNNRGRTVPVRPLLLFRGFGRVVRGLESTPVKGLEFSKVIRSGTRFEFKSECAPPLGLCTGAVVGLATLAPLTHCLARLIVRPMTRLTHTTYKCQHHQLRREWLDRHGFAFTMLSPTEQILIHDFYEPSKLLTDRQLRAHRAAITRARPSLPHQAGKAFVRITPFLDVVPAPLRSPGRGKPYSVKVTSLVNPQIDPARLAKILIDITRERLDHNM